MKNIITWIYRVFGNLIIQIFLRFFFVSFRFVNFRLWFITISGLDKWCKKMKSQLLYYNACRNGIWALSSYSRGEYFWHRIFARFFFSPRPLRIQLYYKYCSNIKMLAYRSSSLPANPTVDLNKQYHWHSHIYYIIYCFRTAVCQYVIELTECTRFFWQVGDFGQVSMIFLKDVSDNHQR